ncbi:MAG: protein kinase [Planctomycetales bacterium]|nr:protein kinase [Planctomycetales bacterium]
MNLENKIEHDDVGDDLPPDIIAQLLAYDADKTVGNASFDTSAMTAELRKQLEPGFSCIDLLHRAWPDFAEPATPIELLLDQKVIGDYRIVREIGRGGMGVVYEAVQTSLPRRIALKVLPLGALASETQRRRFENEARAAATLVHANIVPVFSIGCEEAIHYYAMQFINGPSLSDVLHALNRDDSALERLDEGSNLERCPGHLSITREIREEYLQSRRSYFRTVATWAMQIAHALDYAHENGVLHRDVKPSNVLLDVRGHAWLTDFGLARLESEAAVTMTGELVGTLQYMSPEQLLGAHGIVDHRADIYSLGMTLYEALTLTPGVRSNDRDQIAKRIATHELPSTRSIDRTIPKELDTIVAKSTKRSARERYESARELADDLRRFLEGKPIQAKRESPLTRTRKWVRRYPVVAVLISICCLLSITLAVGSLLHARALEIALSKSESYRKQAEANEKDALAREQRIEEHRYALHVKLANDAWKVGNTHHMRGFLAPLAESRNVRPGFEWHYLSRQLDSALMVLEGHTKQVNSVAYSPDGEILLSASDDGLINIWSANSGTLITTLRSHKSDVNEVHFSPDGKWFASCGGDGVKIWDGVSFEELHTIQGFESEVACLAISSDGKLIATGCRFDGKRHASDYESVALWEAETWQRKLGIAGFRNHVHSVDFSPRGDFLAIASSEDVVLCDVDSGQTYQRLKGHNKTVYCVRYSTDGSVLVSSAVGSAIVWDLATWLPKNVVPGKSGGTFFSIAISPDARSFATGNNNGMVELWDVGNGEKLSSRLTNTDTDSLGFVMSLAFDPKGARIACGSRPSVVRVFDAARHPDVLATFEIPDPTVQVVMDKSLDAIVAFDHRGRFIRWNSRSGKKGRNLPRTRVRGLSQGRCPLAISDSGEFVVRASDLTWDQVDVIDMQSGSTVATLTTDGSVSTATFCNNDRNIVTTSDMEGMDIATVWETKTFSVVRQQSFSTTDRALENQGGLIGHWTEDSLDIFGVTDFRKQGSIAHGLSRITQSQFSPFSKHVALLSSDTTLTIFDWEKDEVVQQLLGPFDAVAFAPDANAFVTGANGRVQFWSLISGQDMLYLDVKLPQIGKLQFSADGSRLACWSTDGSRSEVRVWTVKR